MTKGGLNHTSLNLTKCSIDRLLAAKQKRSLRVEKLISVRRKRGHAGSRIRSGSLGSSGSGSDSPKSTTSSTDSSFSLSDSELRKNERKIRNRQSAMNSRLKIRAEVDILKAQIQQLQNENMDLKAQLCQGNGSKFNTQKASKSTAQENENLDNNNVAVAYAMGKGCFDFNGHAVQL
mmetsp:Transcript_15542/g.25894  ORF Transcript_15542/g.25894 Transcript_15542/m.25894 type:complete len:177 (-) Transcript_15542:401-931(-)